MNISCLAYNQPDDSNNLRTSVLQEYKAKLVSMRNLILFQMNQLEITLSIIEALLLDLNEVIEGIDNFINAPSYDEMYDTLEKAQIAVRNARKCLLLASSILKSGASRLSSKTVLFEKYDEFTDIILEAIKLLEAFIS